jgi:hypothetical protein
VNADGRSPAYFGVLAPLTAIALLIWWMIQ